MSDLRVFRELSALPVAAPDSLKQQRQFGLTRGVPMFLADTKWR
jgi:hypothetical protein